MSMVQIVNIVLGVLSIGFGAIALLAPRYAMEALKLQTAGDARDGMSELRAASGGAFVGLALAGLAVGAASPFVWVMVGVHYLGAGAGRLLSILLDGSGSAKILFFFAVELAFGLWFVIANWP